MKKYLFGFLIYFLSLGSLSAQADFAGFLSETDQFLKKYVRSGSVDYPNLAQNQSDLKPLIEFIARASIQNLNQTEQKAFYINAYNLLVINQIIENYPSNSPQSIGGFFDTRKQIVAEEKITLNELEKQKLLIPTGDARLHFVLVCAAKGCPKIADFAFQPDQLDAQIDQQTRLALNDPEFIRLDESTQKAAISEIFTWYRADFQKDGRSVLDFINQYRDKKLDGYQISSYPYDWALNSLANLEEPQNDNSFSKKSNLQVFTPSALFKKGQFEINFFNNLYSQTSVRDHTGESLELNQRQNFLNTMIQFTYGVSRSARVNLGLDLYINSASIDNASGSPLKHFFGDVNFRQTALSYIGPRIKFVPIKKLPRVSIQSTLIIPIASNLENREGRFVSHDRYTWLTQIFTDFNLGNKFQVFLEEAVFYRIKRNDEQESNFARLFFSGFLSYFPSSKLTVFGFGQYAPQFERLSNGFDSQFGLSQWFVQVGVGAKYQLLPQLGLEASYGNFVASRRDGAGSVINFGLRFISH